MYVYIYVCIYYLSLRSHFSSSQQDKLVRDFLQLADHLVSKAILYFQMMSTADAQMVQSLSDAQMQVASIHGYRPSMVLKVQGMIDEANKGVLAPNTALEDIWAYLLDAKVVKTMHLQVDEVGCHPGNRGKLGLNPHNVRRNAERLTRWAST